MTQILLECRILFDSYLLFITVVVVITVISITTEHLDAWNGEVMLLTGDDAVRKLPHGSTDQNR